MLRLAETMRMVFVACAALALSVAVAAAPHGEKINSQQVRIAASKAFRLSLDVERIGQLMAEAKERYDLAMDGAQTALVVGVLQGSVNQLQAGSADLIATVTRLDLDAAQVDTGPLTVLLGQLQQKEEEIREAKAAIEGRFDAAEAEIMLGIVMSTEHHIDAMRLEVLRLLDSLDDLDCVICD
jgi:hypothetical protein